MYLFNYGYGRSPPFIGGGVVGDTCKYFFKYFNFSLVRRAWVENVSGVHRLCNYAPRWHSATVCHIMHLANALVHFCHLSLLSVIFESWSYVVFSSSEIGTYYLMNASSQVYNQNFIF